MKTVVCQICGESFQTSGKYAKYCASCKQEGYRRSERKRRTTFGHIRLKGVTNAPMLIMQEEYIKICLNCVKPDCSGHCNLLPDYHGA